MTKENSCYLIESVSSNNQGLRIEWADGHISQFHSIWLRHQCECTNCGTPINAVRGIRLHHIPDTLNFDIESTGPNAITLIWHHEDHVSRYQARWLRDHCYADCERDSRRHRPLLWDRKIGDNCPLFDMLACERSPDVRLTMLETVHDYGFCRIENAPKEASEAGRLIEIVGTQRKSHYGTYVLSKKGKVDNVGDITDALDPHIDETYRLSVIGITVFQVLHPSSNGGHSTLVDGFEVTRRLRETYPDDFNLLTRVPITGCRRDTAYNSDGNVKWYAATMPVIRIDFDGHVTGIRFNERQIMPLDLPVDLIEPTYQALKHFSEILYDPELCLTLNLQAGEGLIFDNQRILHGRTAFKPEEPARSVLTSSVDIEEFHSNYRLLHEQVRGVSLTKRLRQGIVA